MLIRPTLAPAAAGGKPSLIGFRLIEAEHARRRGEFALHRLGDFRRGYLIVDRQGVRVLRDPYSAKPYILFYTKNASAAACRILTPSSC
jgi:HK97 family phage major capsid protein